MKKLLDIVTDIAKLIGGMIVVLMPILFYFLILLIF